MKANEILLTATDTIRDRGLQYGHPADNLQHTAMLLSAYLQTPIHDYQVAGIMVLVKPVSYTHLTLPTKRIV